ncbi:hypothetical protein ACFU99_05795 [Streptomyces sp. NPDC057654]|uniref:hypothetical protein n=1 Tax=Streptomyces sp. NPDC057654 TaxID=3346196 RepID=UPI0036A72B6C
MILLTGIRHSGGNLVIESSREFSDGTPDEELDSVVDQELEGKANGWAASFLVDSHRPACQEAYEVYVREFGDDNAKLIDNVWGVLVDD